MFRRASSVANEIYSLRAAVTDGVLLSCLPSPSFGPGQPRLQKKGDLFGRVDKKGELNAGSLSNLTRTYVPAV